MRLIATTILTVAVFTLLAAAAAAAAGDIMFDNQYATNASSTDPHATTAGLIWIDTGNGVPFKVPNLAVENGDNFPPPASDCAWDLNIELLGGTTPDNLADLHSDPAGGGEPPNFTTLLLKDIPFGDGSTNTPNCGQYDTAYSSFAGGFVDSSQAYVYNVPGGGVTSESAYFVLRAWTGDFTSFNAALVGGALVGTTPVFLNPVESGINPIPDLVQMPALIVRPYLPGDANLDGQVDINDLTIVLANYDQTGQTWGTGEFTGDGTVDINDLTIVLAHYGQSVGSSAAGNVSAVPEPSVAALLATGLAGAAAAIYGLWRRQHCTARGRIAH